MTVRAKFGNELRDFHMIEILSWSGSERKPIKCVICLPVQFPQDSKLQVAWGECFIVEAILRRRRTGRGTMAKLCNALWWHIWHLLNTTDPVLEYVDMISRRDLCLYKRSYLRIIVLDHIFYVPPIHEISRVGSGKQEAVLINVEIIRHPSHILHERWFPILVTHYNGAHLFESSGELNTSETVLRLWA